MDAEWRQREQPRSDLYEKGSKRGGLFNMTGAMVKSVADNELVLEVDNSKKKITLDTVIQATGFAADNSLFTELTQKYPYPVWNIGDAKEPGNVLASVRDGFFVAKKI